MSYAEFLERRSHSTAHGFAPTYLPSFLFDFQGALVDWGVRRGRGALFADCGMGKSPMQLVWSQNVVEHTNQRVLILVPLAVAHQTIAEATKFGVKATRSTDGTLTDGIIVTNYERLHYFNPNDFAGVVLDESSILKSFDGTTRQAVTAFMRKIPYRLLATATAAPNDYIELGSSSEALGELGYMDVLNRFFKNDLNNSATNRYHGKAASWRFKGHAEEPFWRFVSSWARALRRPSDLGFDDRAFTLPPLEERETIIDMTEPADGMLFALPAIGLAEQRAERRRSLTARCELLAKMSTHDEPAIAWCHLNDEADLLESLIPGAIQVSGSDSDDEKEEKFMAFASGQARVLVTKPTIGAWGLNFQHCAHVLTFPSHSFEQYYQSVRRCWRFGQPRAVRVDIVASEGERGVLANLRGKGVKADAMFSALTAHMRNALGIRKPSTLIHSEHVPSWLSQPN